PYTTLFRSSARSESAGGPTSCFGADGRHVRPACRACVPSLPFLLVATTAVVPVCGWPGFSAVEHGLDAGFDFRGTVCGSAAFPSVQYLRSSPNNFLLANTRGCVDEKRRAIRPADRGASGHAAHASPGRREGRIQLTASSFGRSSWTPPDAHASPPGVRRGSATASSEFFRATCRPPLLLFPDSPPIASDHTSEKIKSQSAVFHEKPSRDFQWSRGVTRPDS